MSTAGPADTFGLTSGAELAGIIGITRTSALFLVRVLFNLFRYGRAVTPQFLADYAKGSVFLKTLGNNQAINFDIATSFQPPEIKV